MKMYFGTLDIIGQRKIKKKVQELTHPSTTSMCPPSVKYKPKKGNKKIKKGKESNVHRDPSQWKYADNPQKSEYKEIIYKTNWKSTMYCVFKTKIFVSVFYFLASVNWWHFWCGRRWKLWFSGYCNFNWMGWRVLAFGSDTVRYWNYQHHQLYFDLLYDIVLEVRSVLLIASLGVQGREKWMVIPDIGYPIASR